jgi:hypothetical protein
VLREGTPQFMVRLCAIRASARKFGPDDASTGPCSYRRHESAIPGASLHKRVFWNSGTT